MNKNIVSLAAIALALNVFVGCGLQTAEPDEADTVVQGPKGDKGEPGRDGKDGEDGKDGKNATGGAGGSAGAAGSGGSGGSAGAAGSGGSGNGPYDVSCGTEYPLVTQPMYSPAAWKLSMSGQYLPDGAASVQLVGELPGYTWQTGITAEKKDDRWVVTVPSGTNAGTYNVSYKSGSSWADYGTVEERVACMAPEAKAWLWCETKVVSGVSHLNGCGLRINIASNGTITAAGNTRNWGE